MNQYVICWIGKISEEHVASSKEIIPYSRTLHVFGWDRLQKVRENEKHTKKAGGSLVFILKFPYLYQLSCGTNNSSKIHPCVLCFLPIHSGHQVRWTYQPGSHRRKVTQDF